MLAYKTIYTVNQCRERLKYNRYDSPWHRDDANTRDGDELSVFTFLKQAQTDSEQNLSLCLHTAKAHGMSLLIITPSRLQVAGDGEKSASTVAAAVLPRTWLEEYNAWIESSSPMQPRLEDSRHGDFFDFYTYRKSLCLTEHQGVYDVATGHRIKNRRKIIERMWELGFAAHRGRPLTLARPRWAGEREELEEITDLADRYWTRRNRSDAAKKLVSAFTSINRYCAWPGAW